VYEEGKVSWTKKIKIDASRRRFFSDHKINDNAYRVNLPGEYDVSAIFNVSNLFLFDVNDNSMTNPFKKRRNNVIQTTLKNSLEVLVDLVTRLRAKRFKEAFNGLLQDTWAKMDFKMILNNEEQTLINLIHVQEWLVSGHLDITKRLD